MVREQVKELYERDKRRNSIIVKGIPLASLQVTFSKVSKFLCPDSGNIVLSDVVPIKDNIIRTKVLNFSQRRNLLSNTKKLLNSPFPNVFISQNRTYAQRSEFKSKRDSFRRWTERGIATACH